MIGAIPARRRDPGDRREFAVADVGEEARRRVDHVGAPIRSFEDLAVGLVRRPDAAVVVDAARVEAPAHTGRVGLVGDRRIVEADDD